MTPLTELMAALPQDQVGKVFHPVPLSPSGSSPLPLGRGAHSQKRREQAEGQEVG